MVDQAKAAGYSFPTDPMLAMLDVLKEIAKVLGADIPESAKRAADAVRDIPPAPYAPYGGDYGYPDTGKPYHEDMPSYDVGTPWVPRDGPAMLHKGEMVVPPHANPNRAGGARLGGGPTSPQTMTVQLVLDGRTLATQVVRPAMRNNTADLRSAAQGGARGY